MNNLTQPNFANLGKKINFKLVSTLGLLLLLLTSNLSYAQPGNMSINQDVSGTYANTAMTLFGGAYQARFQEGTGTSSGTRNWQFNSDSYSNTWGARSANTLAAYNTTIVANTGTASGNWANGCTPSCYNAYGKLPATLTGYYYTYNLVKGSAYASQLMGVLETSYNPVSISSVAQANGTFGSRTITITTSGTPNASENIYVRYSTNSYAASTLVQATGSGTTWTATIPWQSSAVSFYVYTSPKILSTINTEVGTTGQGVHDVSMLKLNNNGGTNYSWTPATGAVIVTSTGGTSANTPVGYSSFTVAAGLFSVLNTGTVHTGTVTALVTADITTETGATVLSNSAAWTALTINPNGARTISGTVAAALISLSGADNVTINGLNANGNSLTISNLSTSATSGTCTILFSGDATNNTITNCNVLGSSKMAAGTNGGNIFFTTGTTTGNDNNTISNCNIGPAGVNLPTKGIYSSGTTTTTARNNSGITINNNNIYDYFGAALASAGIYINGGSTDINITNNKFYQTASRTQTTASNHAAVYITNTSGNNFAITGNTIGYASSTGTGVYNLVGISGTVFNPIYLNVGSTTATSVQGNTIAGIAQSGSMSGTGTSSSFRGIYVAGGLTTIGNVTGNTIGSLSATGSITFTSSSISTSEVYGMLNWGLSNWTTNNNNIGGFTVANSSTGATNFYGLRCNTTLSVSWACTGNTIGGTVANSISSTSTATGTIVNGILCDAPSMTATGNIIRNMTVAGGTGTGASASMIGISITATSANHTVQQNTIFGLANSNSGASAVQVAGIRFNATTGTNLIARNLVYNLGVATSVSSSVNGITAIIGTATYQNNMVRLGYDAAGTASTGGHAFNGIIAAGGTNNFYHNSVYIGGTGVTGSTATYAFICSTTNTRSIRDNIFFNGRSNTAGTGKHYAISESSTTGLTINYNDYFANGTGGVLGAFAAVDKTTLAAWATSTTQDSNSVNSDPKYIAPTSATPDLHINAASATSIEGTGTALITDDYDGETRSGLTPTDIGADAGNFTPIAPTIVLSTNTIAAGNLTQNTTVPVYSFGIAVSTANANLTGLSITTTGTYALADVTSFAAYYQTSVQGATWTGTGTLLSTYTNAGGATTITFPSFTSQSIVSGTNGYIFIAATVPCTATATRTVIVSAVTASNTTFAAGTPTGTPAVGNTQTVPTLTVNNVTSPGATVAAASSVLTWTAPTGCVTEVLIVAAPATNTGTPTGDGTAYTASLAYGGGTGLGNGFVVYKGSTSSQTVTGLTNGTTYFFKIYTRLGTAWSTGVEVSATPAYCVTTPSTVNPIDIITNVSLTNSLGANYSNASTSNGTNNFESYSNTPLGLVRGSTTNTLAITVGNDGTQASAAWIDFNANGVFEAGENIALSSALAGANAVVTYSNITIPSGATLGITKMRVRAGADVVSDYTAAGACTASPYGETEDYRVNIIFPTISTSGTINAFTSCSGTASTAQSFTVSGTDLTANLVVTAPTGFEVSTSQNGTYASNVSFTPSSGTVSSQTVWVRLSSGATGTPSGNITCVSSPATTQNVAVSGTVNATPQGSFTGNTFCTGGQGTLTWTATSGATTGLTVIYNDGVANRTASSVTSGTAFNVYANPSATTNYTLVSVADTNCTRSSGFTADTATITITSGGVTGVSNPSNSSVCSGNTTTFTASGTGVSTFQWQVNTGSGFVDITAAGTNPVYSDYTSGTLTLTGVVAGNSGYTYRCVMTPPCGDAATTTAATLTVNATPISTISSQTNVLCFGASTGSATASGGDTYAWSGGGTSATKNGLAAGTYTVTVTSSGCSATASVTITEPASALVANAGADVLICPGGSSVIGGSPTASGGTSGYTYLWSPATDLSATNVANPISTPTANRTYTVTVTDSNGCSATDNVEVVYIASIVNNTFIGTITSGGDTSLNTPANWSLGHQPTRCENAIITLAGAGISANTYFLGLQTADFECNNLTITWTGSGNASNPRSLFIYSDSYNYTIYGNLSLSNTSGGAGAHKLYFTNGNGNVTVYGSTTVGQTGQSYQSIIGGQDDTSTGVWTFYDNVTYGPYGLHNYNRPFVFDKNGSQTLTNNTLYIAGATDMGSITVGSSNNTTLTLAGSAALITRIDSAVANGTGGGNLTVNSGSTLILPSGYTLNQVTPSTGIVTVNGSLKLGGSTGGQTGSNFPSGFLTNTLAATSTVEYNSLTTVGQTIFATPTYGNLTLTNGTGSGATTKTAGGALTVAGNLLINSAATFAASTFTHNIAGNWTNNGAFTPSTGRITLNGSSGTQTVTGNTTFYNLTLSNSGATTAFGSTTTTIANNLSASAGTMDGGTGTIIFTGSSGVISGASSKNFYNLQFNSGAVITNSGAGNIFVGGSYTNGGTSFTQLSTNTITFNGESTQDMFGVGASIFGSFLISGAHTVNSNAHSFTIAGSSININNGSGIFNGNTGTVTFAGTTAFGTGNGTYNFNNLTINSSFSLSNATNSKDFNVGGNFANSGTYTKGTETITFTKESGTQTVNTGGSTLNSVNHSGAGVMQLLTNNLTIGGTLTLNGGNIDGATNSKDVVITNSATSAIVRTAGYVNYKLKRAVATTGADYLWPVGFSTNYTPATYNFINLTAGDLEVLAVASDETNLASSSIDATKSVNMYWTTTPTSAVSTNYSGNYAWPVGLNDAGVTAGSFQYGKFNAGTSVWAYPTISGTPTTTTLAFTGANGLVTNHAIGNCKTATTATVGANQTICEGTSSTVLGGNAPTIGTGAWSVTAVPSGGNASNITFGNTATANTTAAAAAGTVAGAYTLTWTISYSDGPCSSSSAASLILTVNAQPTATAGGTQTICQIGTATVSGASSSNGTILWTENGAGSITAGATTLTPTYTAAAGDAGNTVTLTMTVSNSPCTAATATYSVVVNASPTTATAGPDQSVCSTNTITLAANTATSGTGAWSIVSGSGGTVTSPSSPTSTFTGTAGTTYTLRWTISSGVCTASTDDVIITIFSSLDFVNLQFPGSATICQGSYLTAYGQVYESGVTPGAGVQGANITVEFGYNGTNTDPSTWTNWATASFNSTGGGTNNDEYQYVFTPSSAGTYYYAFRYKQGTCSTWQYGGYSSGGGGTWGGSNVSGVLTVNSLPNQATAISYNCTGSAVLTATAGSNETVAWYTTNSQSGALASNQTYSGITATLTIASPSAGSYYAFATNANGCMSANGTQTPVEVTAKNNYTGGVSGTNTDWFTAGNWSCGTVPTASTNVIIPTDKIVTVDAGAALANTIVLEGTANVTVTSNDSMSVTNKVTVASGAIFTVQNNASLVQITENVVNEGNITVQKSTPSNRPLYIYDAVMWSSPVAQKLKAMSTGTLDAYYMQHLPLANTWSAVANPTDTDFTTGKGYLVRTPMDFSFTNAQPWNVSFVGVPNNGAITYNAGNMDSTERFLLVGNPYPSAIDIDKFKLANQNITGVFYFYRKPNSATDLTGYGTLNSDGDFVSNDGTRGSLSPGSVIPSGQGFFVRMKNNSNDGKIYFTNAMRVDNDHGHFNRINTNIDKYRLFVQTPTTGNNQLLVKYDPDTTVNYDLGVDAPAFTDGSTDLSSIMNTKFYRIQARGEYNAADVVPLRFKTGVAGEHRIKLQDAQGVFAADQMVIIKDNLTGVQHNLTANGDYVFTATAGTFTNRFEVIYQQAYYTTLQANSCGATIANMSSLVYADLVNGATGYRFKVVNNTTAAVQTIDRPQHWFAFNMLSAYDYNTPYTISVQVQKDGVWTGYYGATCTVNSPNIATTGIMQINPSQCGMTLPTIGTVIATTPVAGATGYKFRITNTTANAIGNNLVQEITRTNHWFTLGMLSRYNYGSSYAIEVAVKTTGAFTPYGNACTVYAPAVPTLASCGQTVATATTLVRTTAMTLATQYRFQVTRMSTQETITFDTANFWFSFRVNVPGYAAGEQYAVRVAVMTAGAWSPYGDACDITAPIATARTTEEAAPSEAGLFKPVAYPNPFASEFSIALATPFQDDVTLVVYDLQGRLIEKQTVPVTLIDTIHIGANYQMGDYMLVVSQGPAIESMLLHKE